MDPVIQIRLARITSLATGTTIMWHDEHQNIRWGRYITADPINEHQFPRVVTVRVAPGHRSWPSSIIYPVDALACCVLNADALPPMAKVLP
jgi:hypothetical protein